MAVYTSISLPELEQFLSHYDIGTLCEWQGIIQGVENSNYYICTDKGKFILTLFEKRVREKDLPWFLGLMHHLSQKGLCCPKPIANCYGFTFSTLASRPAAIVSFLPGKDRSTLEPDECYTLGRFMGKMHLCGTDYTPVRNNSMGPSEWVRLMEVCQRCEVNHLSPIQLLTIKNYAHNILAEWPKIGTLPIGHIHADLFPDNILFSQNNLTGIIDFYFACSDFLVYDLAVTLNSCCMTDDGYLDNEKTNALITGYQSIRPLQEEEKTAFFLFSAGSALRFLLSRLYDLIHTPQDALVRPKDPLPFLRRLEFHIQKGNLTPNVYGF